MVVSMTSMPNWRVKTYMQRFLRTVLSTDEFSEHKTEKKSSTLYYLGSTGKEKNYRW